MTAVQSVDEGLLSELPEVGLPLPIVLAAILLKKRPGSWELDHHSLRRDL